MASVEQQLGSEGISSSVSSTKLPILQDGASLVSPITSARIPSIKEEVSEWALEVRQR